MSLRTNAFVRLRSREITPIEALNSCLSQIDAHEKEIRAWTFLDREGARREAERQTAALARGESPGPLAGVVIGVKDIVDVVGWPTVGGFEPYRERIAACDAPVVAALRAAGAIVLGKTVTCQLACFDPSITRNPRDVRHTPGGSSSGSAAAVAAGMCLAAIGTQTGGSLMRPAAYCGVASLKPGFGQLSTDGVLPVSGRLDHVGLFAPRAADLLTLWQGLAISGDAPFQAAEIDPLTPGDASLVGTRLLVLEDAFWQEGSSAAQEHFAACCRMLTAAGATLVRLETAIDWDAVLAVHRTIMASDCATVHRENLARWPEAFAPKLRGLIEEGLRIGPAQLQEAGEEQLALRAQLAELWRDGEQQAILTPATPTAAPPLSDGTTGDPRYNSPWSLLGWPTIALPAAPDRLAATGPLPLAVQLIGPPAGDAPLLRLAGRLENALWRR